MNPSDQKLHRLSLYLMAAYLVALVLIVFWPTPVDRPAAENLNTFIGWMHRHGVPSCIGYRAIEFSANIALFVPMGIIASLWTKRVWAGLLAGLLTSVTIEFGQAVFLAERYASGLDVLANTSGAVIGAALYFLFHGVHLRRVSLSAAQQS